ncbi:glycosyltransferase family 2 protein [Microbulbifer sp. SSSA005]|uniref:glycosyltransferase family 2 protein n=1 Tax=Microbulbifer sp. SSSA005 TaxID=3243378 RepID=UPI004039BB5E
MMNQNEKLGRKAIILGGASSALVAERAINSLLPQVEHITYLSFSNRDNLNQNYSSQVKFKRINENAILEELSYEIDSHHGYILICHNSLIYPNNYAACLCGYIEDLKRQAVVGIQGGLYKFGHENSAIHPFYASDKKKSPTQVHFLSIFGSAFHRDVFSRGVLEPLKSINFMLGFYNCTENFPPLFLVPGNRDLINNSKNDFGIWRLEKSLENLESACFEGADSDCTGLLSSRKSSLKKVPGREKVIIAIKTYNRLDYLSECLKTWLASADPKYDWVVIVADDGSTDGTLEYLEMLDFPFELHILKNRRKYAVGQTNTIFDLCKNIGFDFAFLIDDDLLFKKKGWDSLYINAIKSSGYAHLCYFNPEIKYENEDVNSLEDINKNRVVDPSGTCEAFVDCYSCMGCLFTFTEVVLEKVGYCDEKNFPVRGQWHIDFSARCSRLGFNKEASFFDALGSNHYITLQHENSNDYRCAISWGSQYASVTNREEKQRRYKVIYDDSRLFIPKKNV